MMREGHLDKPVFCNVDGGHLRISNLRWHSFLPILRRAGLRMVPLYALRHTSATLQLLEGVPVKMVAERLGHADVGLTMNLYQHWLPAMGRQAVEGLARALRIRSSGFVTNVQGCAKPLALQTDADLAAQIVDPARQQARLDDDDGRLRRAQQGLQFGPRRLERGEAHFARGLVEDTGHALVFAQVDGENGARGRGGRDRVHGASLRWG